MLGWAVLRLMAYSRFPVRVITAESTARGAVSQRRMRGPRPTVLAPALAAISASSAAKPPSAPVMMAIFAVSGLGLRQQLAERFAAALIAEEHEVVPGKAAADRPEIGQGQSHIRQHAPAALLGGLKGDAVVALVFLLLFFGGGHAVAAEERDKVGAAQLHAVFDDLFQFVLLGVARQQGDFHTGFGGAGVARFHAELHALVPEPGDGGGVLHSVAVT